MEVIPLDSTNIGAGCCIRGVGTSHRTHREIHVDPSEGDQDGAFGRAPSPSSSPPGASPCRSQISPGTTPDARTDSPRDFISSFANGEISDFPQSGHGDGEGSSARCAPTPDVADEYLSIGDDGPSIPSLGSGSPRGRGGDIMVGDHDRDDARILSSPASFFSCGATRCVADDYYTVQDGGASDFVATPTDDVGDDPSAGRCAEANGCRAAAASPPSPKPHSREDLLALEVGLSAQEYLEECFLYTEVSVLDRDKFDAVPEIVKDDFTVLSHLGKGCFSDVFEVECKVGQLLDVLEARDAPPPSPDGSSPHDRRRSSRRSPNGPLLSSSINTATLSRHARHGDRRRHFALKCLRPQIRSDPEQFTIGAEDIVHETAILATLEHSHIVRLYGRASGELSDAFLINDGYFILLEKLSGTLPDRMKRWKRDSKSSLREPISEQIEAARDVADAMVYLHSRRIVFRDLKSTNVGYDPRGVLKLFDFGFATGLPEKDESNPEGMLYDRCGTPRYMAPEVGLGEGYGLGADVYSVGILLWEICALSKPFADITTPEEFDQRVFVEGERPWVDDVWPAAVRDLMEACWSAHQLDRPAISAVRSVLTNHLNGMVPPSPNRMTSAQQGRTIKRSMVTL